MNPSATNSLGPQKPPSLKAYNSEGERRVRSNFNSAGMSVITRVKEEGAQLINQIDALVESDDWTDPERIEFRRCKATAITQVELGTMMAVKAATTGL